MSDTNISFGSAESFGAVAGWDSQRASDATNKTRVNVLAKDGNEVTSQLFNTINEITEDLKCNNNTNTVPANLGAVVNAVLLTSIAISTTAEDFASMTLTGHQHAVKPHDATNAPRTVAHGQTVPAAFGAKDFMGGTPGTDASAIAGSVTIVCEHVDQVDKDGNHLVGENYNARMEARTTWCGTPTAYAAAGWDVTVNDMSDENTGFKKYEVTGIKKLTLA